MEPTSQTPARVAKPYETPAIVYEATLEVRAGTPLGVPVDPLDLLSGGQGQ